ncbi:MAG: LuxR C-terminal-related transcriptional regulator [Thermoflexus sp.]
MYFPSWNYRRRALTLGLVILTLGTSTIPPRTPLAPVDVENPLWYLWSGYVPQIPQEIEAAASPGVPIATWDQQGAYRVYLPLILRAPSAESAEFRALWITRFDWTRADGTWARPEALVAIAEQAAAARFNVLLFQVRGVGDAYYTPGYEPWAARLTGTITRTLGTSPGFDPLRVLLDAAHARGLQVHAYINVYPTWLCGVGPPPDGLNPPHPFWTFSRTNGKSWGAWRVYDASGNPMNLMTCSSYLWATPAWSGVRDQVVRVVRDLMSRYDLLMGAIFPMTSIDSGRYFLRYDGKRSPLHQVEMNELGMISLHAFDVFDRMRRSEIAVPNVLSARELEVLRWTAQGKTSVEIGQILSLSDHTVNAYMTNAIKKLDCVNRTQLVAKAIRLKLIN